MASACGRATLGPVKGRWRENWSLGSEPTRSVESAGPGEAQAATDEDGGSEQDAFCDPQAVAPRARRR